MKNKVLSVCFLIVVLIGVCAINAGASTEETKTQKPKWVLPENFSVEDAARQDESNTQYEAILNYFTQDGVINYPEYYAGAYINNNNYLVVKVTDSITDKNIQELRDVTNNSNLIFEQGAEYSYRYLLGLQEKIINYCNSGSNDAVINNISETMVYNSTNNLEVVLNSNNTSDIRLLMSEIFSETSTRNIQQYPILFTQADADNSFPEEEPVTYANGENTLAISDFYPGLEIQVDIQDGQVAVLTSGFQCYRKVDNTYQYGFITSAHGSRSFGGKVYDKNGNSVGSVRSAARVLSGKVDAAFVQVPSNITMHNTISTVDGDIFFSGTKNVAEGSSIYLMGSQSYTAGKATNVNATITAKDLDGNSVTISDTYKVDYDDNVAQGDSGAPVYTYSGSRAYMVAIHSGSNATGTKGNECKLSNIEADSKMKVHFT